LSVPDFSGLQAQYSHLWFEILTNAFYRNVPRWFQRKAEWTRLYFVLIDSHLQMYDLAKSSYTTTPVGVFYLVDCTVTKKQDTGAEFEIDVVSNSNQSMALTLRMYSEAAAERCRTL
jgi:hypothetical protein